MKRRDVFRTVSLICVFGLSTSPVLLAETVNKRPVNVLFLTADDLGCKSLDCFGGKVPELTPNLDQFASQGMRFFRAHVNAAICQPSRGVLATGRYSHNSGITGFYHTDKSIPTIMETLRDAGYLTGILGKVSHSTPKQTYHWDFAHDQNELGNGRDPNVYYSYCKEFLERCRRENKPFYFMVNSHDPHRPFHIPGKPVKGAAEPSRTYRPEDVPVPGYLPDLPGVRQELSYYLNSVRRCDDTFGKVLQALRESGFQQNTLVMFLSDNGMAVPFAKCNAYFASTQTPWIVRWPSVVQPGSIDDTHFISGVDFFPTILDALDLLPTPDGLDGFSFLPLLRGRPQEGRDKVFTQIDRKAGNDAVPMRCVQTEHFGYIFNGWSDGEHYYRNNNEGLCMQAMNRAAKTDPAVAERVNMFRYRRPEELYDLEKDPDSLHNLVDNPEYRKQLNQLRHDLLDWMQRTGDPLRASFEKRKPPAGLDEYLTGIGKAPDKERKRKRVKKNRRKR